MSWNIIIVLVLVGINTVFGLFRGAKNQGLRLLTMVIALAVSMGISVGLQAATGFQLMETVNSIIRPEALEGVITFLKGLVPFGDTVSPILTTMFLGQYSSVLLTGIIFLLVNKLSIFLYHVLSSIGHKTDKIAIQNRKKKLTFTGGLFSTIFGAIIGAVTGLLIACLVFAPISEIVIALA